MTSTLSLDLPGGRVAVHMSAGTAPGALLVHGNSCSARSFAAQLEGDPGRRRRLVALDLPGHGDSGPLAPTDDPFAAYAEVLSQACARLGLEEAALVGHSLGGHLLLEGCALGHFKRARGVMLFGTPPVASMAEFGGAIHPHPEAFTAFADDVDEAALDRLLRLWFGEGGGPAWARTDFRRAERTIRGRIGGAVAGGLLRDERAALDALACPVALLHGADDPLLRADWMAAVAPPARWRGALQLVAGAGHFPQVDRPEAFNALLADFLDDVHGP